MNEEVGSIKELRDAAERGRKATQELDEMKREMAFLKAGVDMESKAGQLLFKAYDGDLETDLIRSEAEDLGVLTSSTPEPDTPVEDVSVEREVAEQRRALSEDSVPPEATTENPYDAGHRQFQEMVAAGRPKEDAAANFVKTVIEAAGSGDDRVVSP